MAMGSPKRLPLLLLKPPQRQWGNLSRKVQPFRQRWITATMCPAEVLYSREKLWRNLLKVKPLIRMLMCKMLDLSQSPRLLLNLSRLRHHQQYHLRPMYSPLLSQHQCRVIPPINPLLPQFKRLNPPNPQTRNLSSATLMLRNRFKCCGGATAVAPSPVVSYRMNSAS